MDSDDSTPIMDLGTHDYQVIDGANNTYLIFGYVHGVY